MQHCAICLYVRFKSLVINFQFTVRVGLSIIPDGNPVHRYVRSGMQKVHLKRIYVL